MDATFRARLRALMCLALPGAVVSLALLAPAGALAAAPQSTHDALIERIQQKVGSAGLDADRILDEDIAIQLRDRTVTVPVREALARLSGASVIDEGANTGVAGTPQLTAGGILHIAANLRLQTFPLTPVSQLPPAPDLRPYDVRESQFSPTTPVVPVINPLVLTGADLPEGAPPGLDDPILLLHPGGRLKSVQGGSWSVLGTHGAGSHGIGHNLDTGARETTDGDPWPVWLPLVTGAMIPDRSIDFLGFGTVVNSSTCTLVRASSNPASPLFGRVIARICVGVGAIIGDGVAQFNGGGPIDFRNDLMPLWEAAPEELTALLGTVDGAVGSLPLGDLLGVIGDLPGADLPELPEGPDTGGQTAPLTGGSAGAGGLLTRTLGGLLSGR